MSLSELCVRRPVFATMLVATLVVLGIFSFRDLGVDLFPKADPATVTVIAKLPGASPDEMNTAVVEPIEETLSSISGIDELSARITEGTAMITCRFVLERDINDAAQDVREKVARAMRNLPPQVEPPIVQKVDPDAEAVITIVASGDMSLRALGWCPHFEDALRPWAEQGCIAARVATQHRGGYESNSRARHSHLRFSDALRRQSRRKAMTVSAVGLRRNPPPPAG